MTTAPPEAGALMTVTEVAAYMKVSRALAYRLVADGTIPSVKVSERAVRVPRERLIRWIEDRSR